MMDMFEFNKIAGAILSSLLLVMVLGIVADIIYTPSTPSKPGYAVAVKQEQTAGASGHKEKIPFFVLLAKADATKGRKQARVCTTCHSFDKGGPNRIGPNLYGVVGRKVATHEGFSYSAAMRKKAEKIGSWSFAALNQFITNPQKYVSRTKMSFAGLRNDERRANLLAYLQTLSDNPLPLPQASENNQPVAGDK
ncbi:MAG: cytochrome c family protein [Hyphomicrobiales bacterium]